MFKLGQKMKDERAMVYLVVGLLAVLALLTRLAFILATSLNPDSFENSLQSTFRKLFYSTYGEKVEIDEFWSKTQNRDFFD